MRSSTERYSMPGQTKIRLGLQVSEERGLGELLVHSESGGDHESVFIQFGMLLLI